MILLSVLPRRSTALGILAGLVLVTGCKPSPTPKADPDVQPQGSAARQMDLNGMRVYCQTLLPPTVRLTDLKTDAPMRAPNTSPADHVWLVNAKLTRHARRGPADPARPGRCPRHRRAGGRAKRAGRLAQRLRALTLRSHLRRVRRARLPTAPCRSCSSSSRVKDKPLAPIYGQIAAQWQVDHWRFDTVDLTLPPLGQPRASFTGSTMVKGSTEAEAFLAAEKKAIAEARDKQAAIESRYTQDLRAATQPGTTYQGQISHGPYVLPCTLRFLIPPPGGDEEMTSFEVKLTNEPSYQYVYAAKLVTALSVGVPAKLATNEQFTIPSDRADATPVGNLIVNFLHGTGGGKDESGKTPPGMVLRGQVGMYTAPNQPFLVLDHHIQGIAAQYTNGDFVLKAQLKP